MKPSWAGMLALAFASAFLCVVSDGLAQYPQARLNSLSRPGVRAGETVEVSLRGNDLEGVTRLWFDHPALSAVHVKDLTFRVSAGPDVPLGHFDLRDRNLWGQQSAQFIVGGRPESIEAEPNNSPDKAGPIAVNTVMNGEINGGADVDCFALEGKKGQRLFLDLAAERIDSRLDATIRVLTPSGTELAESRDVFGLDPFLDVTLPADGRYVIKVHDAIYAGSTDHVYRLSVHDGPHLDAILPAAADPGSPTTFTIIGRGLGVGASVDSRLKAGGLRPRKVEPSDRPSRRRAAGTRSIGAGPQFCYAAGGRVARRCRLQPRADRPVGGIAGGLELAVRRQGVGASRRGAGAQR